MTTKFIQKFDDADLSSAIRRGRSARTNRLHAQSVRYIVEKDGVEVVLENGVTLFWPRNQIKEFADVGPAQMSDIQLSPRGGAIELETADVDIDITGLVADLVPMEEFAAALARHGRQKTSTEQAEAARRNGAKGGRPKKLDADNVFGVAFADRKIVLNETDEESIIAKQAHVKEEVVLFKENVEVVISNFASTKRSFI